jgi:hypothetical protein
MLSGRAGQDDQLGVGAVPLDVVDQAAMGDQADGVQRHAESSAGRLLPRACMGSSTGSCESCSSSPLIKSSQHPDLDGSEAGTAVEHIGSLVRHVLDASMRRPALGQRRRPVGCPPREHALRTPSTPALEDDSIGLAVISRSIPLVVDADGSERSREALGKRSRRGDAK